MRYSAVKALSALSPHLSSAQHDSLFESLTQALRDDDKYVRYSAVKALSALSPHLSSAQHDSLFEPLNQALRDDNWYVRKSAVNALSALSPHLSSAPHDSLLESLTQTLRDDDWEVRDSAANALSALSPHLSSAQHDSLLESLNQALRDDDSGVRYSAVNALSTLLPHLHYFSATLRKHEVKLYSKKFPQWSKLSTSTLTLRHSPAFFAVKENRTLIQLHDFSDCRFKQNQTLKKNQQTITSLEILNHILQELSNGNALETILQEPRIGENLHGELRTICKKHAPNAVPSCCLMM